MIHSTDAYNQHCCSPPSITERLQQIASGVNKNNPSAMVGARSTSSQAPPAYTIPPSEDGHQAYSTAGSSCSIPTSAPGMYGYGNSHGSQPGAQSPQKEFTSSKLTGSSKVKKGKGVKISIPDLG